MPMNVALLPEYDQEMANLRKTLERLPDDKLAWAPHPKSMTMGHLAKHVADLPKWAAMTFDRDALDLAPGGKEMERPAPPKSRAEVLEQFDKNVIEGRAAIANADDEKMLSNWSLQHNGQNLFTMPKITVLRTWVLNHMVHHRAQLGVYLRLNDVAVPSIYGPSADEAS